MLFAIISSRNRNLTLKSNVVSRIWTGRAERRKTKTPEKLSFVNSSSFTHWPCTRTNCQNTSETERTGVFGPTEQLDTSSALHSIGPVVIFLTRRPGSIIVPATGNPQSPQSTTLPGRILKRLLERAGIEGDKLRKAICIRQTRPALPLERA